MKGRLVLVVALLFWSATGLLRAQSVATVELSAYPAAAVADGKSTLTVSATIRDRSGAYVPNGTQVAFSTSLGNFQESVAGTAGGVARVTLVAPNVVGRAKITATAVNFAAVAGTEVDFVADASQIVKSTIYVEATGTRYLAYGVDIQTIQATGADHGAKVTFHDIAIEADDLQLDVSQMQVIAFNAVLRVGSRQAQMSKLNYRLRDKQGTASAVFNGKEQMVAVNVTDLSPLNRMDQEDEFRFTELMDSPTIVVAKHVTALPGRQVLFDDATVYLGGNRLASFHHYVVDPNKQSGLLSMEEFGVNQDGVSLDLPYYLALGPRESSSLRLRSQYVGGLTYSNSRGMSLDWVTKYSDSDKYSGDITVSDLSTHWGMTLRHTQKLSQTMDGYFVLDSPRHESVSGIGQLSQQFRGFYATMAVSGSQGFQTGQFNQRRADLTADTNSRPLFGKALFESFGVTSSYEMISGSSTNTAVREAAGLRYRVRTASMQFRGGTLSASTTLSKLWGRNAGDGIGVQGTLTSAYRLGSRSSLAVSYDYTAAQLSSSLLGKHHVTANLSGSLGRLSGAAYLTRSLDIPYTNLLMDTSFHMTKVWRIGYSYTWDRYLDSSFRDYSVILGFNAGIREIGIRWSNLTRRFSLELNAASF